MCCVWRFIIQADKHNGMDSSKIKFMSVCPSVRMELLGSHWMDFSEIWYFIIFRKSVEKIQVSLRSRKNNGYFTRISIFQTKSYRENQHSFIFHKFFFVENHAVYETMCKNMARPGRSQMTIRRMCIACCIPKVTNAQSQYVTVNCFPLQRKLHECASMLRYTYIAYLVHITNSP